MTLRGRAIRVTRVLYGDRREANMGFGSNGARPRARDDGLVVERVDDELLVYDLERDRAHRLNEAAALVFERCNGERGVAELAEALSEDSGQQIDEDVVGRALVRLSEAHLLDEPVVAADGHEWSRRQVLKRIGAAGAAGLALPVVTSIVAPTPAEAQASPTCSLAGQPCNTTTPCTEGLPCCPGMDLSCVQTSSGNCICVAGF